MCLEDPDVEVAGSLRESTGVLEGQAGFRPLDVVTLRSSDWLREENYGFLRKAVSCVCDNT